MGFLSNLKEKTRAMKINQEFRLIFEAFSRLQDQKHAALADALENEVAKMMKEEKLYLNAGGIDELQRQLDAGRDLALMYIKSRDEDVLIRGISRWLVAAYWQTKFSVVPQMQSLNKQLMDLMDGLAMINY